MDRTQKVKMEPGKIEKQNSKQVNLSIPREEIMSPGHVACQGCGATLAMRYALKALGRDTVLVLPACCWSVIDGPFPHSAAGVPLFHTAFETAASAASGVAAALEIKKKQSTVLAWAGDGGTADIGIQALSGAAEREENFIYVCYDNEAYMNTGIQRSSSTPYKAWTTTTPVKKGSEETKSTCSGKTTSKKNMVEIMAAHKIPYLGTAIVSYPEDFIEKLRRAKEIKGTKYLQILSPCPVGWKYSSEMTIRIGKLAFESCLYPLYEIVEGRYIVKKPRKKIPIEPYLKLQARFRHLKQDDIDCIQKNIDIAWEKLLRKEELSRSGWL